MRNPKLEHCINLQLCSDARRNFAIATFCIPIDIDALMRDD